MNKNKRQSILTDEDRKALERSAEDVRQGRFATDNAVQKIFDFARVREESITTHKSK